MDRLFSGIIISGVGLLGGSVALAARKAEISNKLFAVCRTQNRCETLLSEKMVDKAFISWRDTIAQMSGQIPEENKKICIVIGTPVCSVTEQVESALNAIRNEGDPSCFYLITDLGSTKQSIVDSLHKVSFPDNTVFIGSHPIAGSEKTGSENACVTLFQDKTTVLTPEKFEENNQSGITESLFYSSLNCLKSFWKRLGSHTICLSAEEHDRILARTSHLPHLLSVILALLVQREEYPLSGTGFADMTRLSAGSPEVWSDIFRTNRKSILAAIADFEIILAEWKAALGTEDAEQRKTLLEEAKKKRDALGS